MGWIAPVLSLVVAASGAESPVVAAQPRELPVVRALPPLYLARADGPHAHGAEHGHDVPGDAAPHGTGAGHAPVHEDRHGHAHDGRFRHVHVSPCGTPQIHGFLTEPAFLGRDVLATVAHLSGPDGDETEAEIEVEWALSRRFLVVPAVARTWTDEENEWEPVGLGARVLAIETNRLMLSAQAEVSIPTSSDQGSGLGASLLSWLDLGGDVTLQTNLGVEVDLDTEEWEAPFALTLAWSTPLRSPFVRCSVDEHGHGIETRIALLAEVAGAIPLSDDEAETSALGLLGVVLPVTHEVEVRGGWTHGLSGDADGADGFVLGLVVHL